MAARAARRPVLARSAPHDRPLDLPIWLIGMAVALAWAAPFVWMVSTSLKYPSDVMTRGHRMVPAPHHLRQLRQGFRLSRAALGPQAIRN